MDVLKKYIVVFIHFWLPLLGICAQGIQIFKVEDFDLKGNVASCMVTTGYGKEFFKFDEKGRLVKSVTQYNDSDRDITYYTYHLKDLVEKRMESYKDDVLDTATSVVNFYTIDSIGPKKVFEKIISYDKQLIEQQEYEYDTDGKLVKITTSNAEGVDETIIGCKDYKNEVACSYTTNGIIEKSVVTSERKMGKQVFKVVILKDYIDGKSNRGMEEVYDPNGKMVSRELFIYNVGGKRFDSDKKHIYSYDREGTLMKQTVTTQNSEAVQEYIYQFDGNPAKNWVKQIITPANTYTARKIKYHPDKNMGDVPD